MIRRGDDWVETWHRTKGGETVGGIETSGGGRGLVHKGEDGRGGIYRSGADDLYLGKDGVMYRHNEDGWSKYENGTWNPVERERGKALQDRADAQKKVSQLPAGQRDQKPSVGTADRSKDISPRVESRPAAPSTKDAGRGTDTHSQLQADRSARSRGDYRASSQPSAPSRSAPMGGGGGRGGGGRR